MRKITGGVLAVLLIVLVFPAAAQADGNDVEDLESSFDSQPEKSVTVTCPQGQAVRGMGGWTHPGGQILTAVTTSENLASVTVSARAQAGDRRLWSVTARAVCGYLGPRRVVGIGSGEATASCEAGELLYGTGFALVRPAGTGYLTGIVPSATVSSVTVTAVATGPEPLSVVAMAICGLTQPEFARTKVTTAEDGTPAKLAVAGKPPMDIELVSAVHGGGALINGTGAFIDGLGPNATLDGYIARAAKMGKYPGLPWLAAARVNGDEEDWSMTTYGTCIGHWYSFEN